MKHCIENKFLKVVVSERGAELQSICGKDGTEYLWQGDKAYWGDRAPTLFPYVARLTDQTYYYENRPYKMAIHGFAPQAVFQPVVTERDRLCLCLTESQETLAQYPFRFRFLVEFALKENSLQVTYRVENRGDKTMYFGLGGHPGFRVPLEDGKDFEDYYLEFAETCRPDRVDFSEDCFVTGGETPYPLEEDRILRLRHDLFDDDAIVLKRTAKKVTLGCGDGGRSVTMSFPDLPILGIWHMPHTDAPYVCLEPWLSLPSRKGEIAHLERQEDLAALEAGKTYETTWSVTLK